jgi:hypothetical protein
MFQQHHRTASGKTLLVAQMDDEHLINMIGAIVSWAERATSQFQMVIAQTQEMERRRLNGHAAMAEAQRKMYGLPNLPTLSDAATQYAEAMNMLAGKLQPYLLEAWTRQMDEADQARMDELRVRWREAVGRSTALPNPEHVLLEAPAVMDEGDDVPF